MSKRTNMDVIKRIITAAMREAWLSGFAAAQANRSGGPGGVLAAGELQAAAADVLLAGIEEAGAVLVPARVVEVLQVLAAAAPQGACQGGDARAVLARIAEMVEAGRTDLIYFKGKEPCCARTSLKTTPTSVRSSMAGEL